MKTNLACLLLVLGLIKLPSLSAQDREITVALPGGAEMGMVWIEAGTFTMGESEENEPILRDLGLWYGWDEVHQQPTHLVTISKGFYLGKYEITQAQWESVMGTKPWSGRSQVQEGPQYPAVGYTFSMVEEFARGLTDIDEGFIYRLPTEAEWEYACKAGTTTIWSFGNDILQIGDYAWTYENTCALDQCYPRPVGTKLPNPWGLYDMHGNIWEWTQDWFGREYTEDPQVDPYRDGRGIDSMEFRIMRGGAYRDDYRYTESAQRSLEFAGAIGIPYCGTRLLRQALSSTLIKPEAWGQVKSGIRSHPNNYR